MRVKKTILASTDYIAYNKLLYHAQLLTDNNIKYVYNYYQIMLPYKQTV